MTQERILRGNRARQIIEDPLFIEAFHGLEQGAIERLARCDIGDTQKLQTLTTTLQTMRAIHRIFEVWMIDGEEAAKKMQKQELEPNLVTSTLNRFRR